MRFALIDIETNHFHQTMTIGVIIADDQEYKALDARYFIIDDVSHFSIYQNAIPLEQYLPPEACEKFQIHTTNDEIPKAMRNFLKQYDITKIFAYNAKFDYGFLVYLHDFTWYDIIEKSAYFQFNPFIKDRENCWRTGRLKRGYGVEPMYRLVTGDRRYYEKHNGLMDCFDELVIMKILNYKVSDYTPINQIKKLEDDSLF